MSRLTYLDSSVLIQWKTSQEGLFRVRKKVVVYGMRPSAHPSPPEISWESLGDLLWTTKENDTCRNDLTEVQRAVVDADFWSLSGPHGPETSNNPQSPVAPSVYIHRNANGNLQLGIGCRKDRTIYEKIALTLEKQRRKLWSRKLRGAPHT